MITISQNIKKERVKVDSYGNIYDPLSKQVIGNVREDENQDYAPPTQESQQEQQQEQTQEQEQQQEQQRAQQSQQRPQEQANPIADMIKKQVNEAVLEAIKGIDIQSMVQKAIADAFGGLK